MQVSLTERYTITVGTNRGYSHDNTTEMEIGIFCRIAQAMATSVGSELNAPSLAPTFIVTPGRAVYSADYGCPNTGEPVYILQGERNPTHCTDAAKYRNAWHLLVDRLQGHFEQTTVRLVEERVKLSYSSRKSKV